MTAVYQHTPVDGLRTQDSAATNGRLTWTPNAAIFSGSIEQQRARLEKVKAESVEQAVLEQGIFINPQATILPTTPPASIFERVHIDLTTDEQASNAKKRTFVDLTGIDNEVTATSEAPQEELGRSPKRARTDFKDWQVAHSVPNWYIPGVPTAEHCAIRPGDKPLTMAANGRHDVLEIHARASRQALAKRRAANDAASKKLPVKHREGAESRRAEPNAAEEEEDAASRALPRNSPIGEEEIEAMFLAEDDLEGQDESLERDEQEEVLARDDPVDEQEAGAMYVADDRDDGQETGESARNERVDIEEMVAMYLTQDDNGQEEMEREEEQQQQHESEPFYQSAAAELLDIFDEERAE